MMPIAVAAFRERAMIGVIAPGVEHAPRGAVPGHAIPSQIGQVGAQRRTLRPVANDARFDGDVPRPVRN